MKYESEVDPECKVSFIGGEIYFCHGKLKFCAHKLYYGSGSICKHPMRASFPRPSYGNDPSDSSAK